MPIKYRNKVNGKVNKFHMTLDIACAIHSTRFDSSSILGRVETSVVKPFGLMPKYTILFIICYFYNANVLLLSKHYKYFEQKVYFYGDI